MKEKVLNFLNASNLFLIIATIVFGYIYSRCCGDIDFFDVTIIDLFMLYFTVVLGIIIVNSQSRTEKIKQHTEQSIIKFQQNFISDLNELYSEDYEKTTQNVLLHNRKINNQLEMIRKYLKKIHCASKELKELDKVINEYLELLSENINKLPSIEQQIIKYNEKIDYLCEQIIYKIYI